MFEGMPVCRYGGCDVVMPETCYSYTCDEDIFILLLFFFTTLNAGGKGRRYADVITHLTL